MQLRITYRLTVAVCILYLLACLWAYWKADEQFRKTTDLHQDTHIKSKWGYFLEIFGERCPRQFVARHSHTYQHSGETVKFSQTWTCCKIKKLARGHNADIQMEQEWNSIGVGYPKYVYTVSGWIETLGVPAYTVKGKDRPLRVFIVPHSHQDPGWLSTFDSYYNSYTKATLDTAVDKMMEHPKWKFIWAEMCFLSRWWQGASFERQQNFKKLVGNGQLEIVSGGWVMSDEANVHYAAMLDQLIEGHQWLQENLGVLPRVSWSIDPFGYSPTMAYLMKKSGVKQIVIQRVHFAVKKHLAESRSLEFYWRQVWDKQGSTDVFCHLMPFLSYAIRYSCGPDPHICCQFDFERQTCFWGSRRQSKISVTENNIQKLSWDLWEQFQKKLHIYKSNILLVPHGDDFRYSHTSEWDVQLGNLEKIMKYMNEDKSMNIKVEFGTLSDYFQALKEDEKFFIDTESKFPSLSGDFLPYNDRGDQYWSGYFTSRPLYKHMARFLQSKLRLTEIWYTLCLARTSASETKYLFDSLKANYSDIESARRSLALFQHHDAITGTSKEDVVKDYADILHGASRLLDRTLKLLLGIVMLQQPKPKDIKQINLTEEWTRKDGPLKKNVIDIRSDRSVVVMNPLTIQRNDVVKLVTSQSNVEVTEPNGKHVRFQINPVFDSHFQLDPELFEVVFEVDLPPLAMKSYIVKPSLNQVVSQHQRASITTFSFQDRGKLDSSYFVKISGDENAAADIENENLQASFSPCTGLLQHIYRKSDSSVFHTEIKLMTYGTGSWSNPYQDKSGAYVFLPDGAAQELDLFHPEMLLVKGPLMSTVHTRFFGIQHSVYLYNISGPLGAALHIKNLVNIGSDRWNNKELIMRLETDIFNTNGNICTDFNGFQLHRRKTRHKMTTQGNFYPLTTMAFLESDHGTRLTLLTSEAHGVASLTPGWIEVVLDRRLMQDDWRGLNQGVKDNILTPSHFMVLVEKLTASSVGEESAAGPACFPSILSHVLSENLNNPLVSAVSPSSELGSAVLPMNKALTKQLACSMVLVNLRSIKPENESSITALLLVHHVGIDCSYQDIYMKCHGQDTLDFQIFQHLSSVTEMSLSGVTATRRVNSMQVKITPMEIRTYKLSFR